MAFTGMGGPEMVGQLHQKREAEKHAQQEIVIDKISQANVEQLMEIQQNVANTLSEKPELFEDPDFNRVINAIFRRSQELLGVDDKSAPENGEVLH